MGKNPLFKTASQLPIPTSLAREKADLSSEKQNISVDKTKNNSAEIKKDKLQNNNRLQIIPVENLQQALRILGIKISRTKNDYFDKKKNSQV